MPEIIRDAAAGSHALHGSFPDTDNQLRRPHRIGKPDLQGQAVSTFIRLLAVVEIGGLALLFAGFVLLLPHIVSKLALA